MKSSNCKIAKRYSLLVLCALLILPVTAQTRRKNLAAKKHAAKVETAAPEPQESPLMLQMLESIQDVMVVDSIVTTTDKMFLPCAISPDEGRVTTTANFLHLDAATKGTAYINAMGDRCIFSRADTKGHMKLYSTNCLAGKWDTPTLVAGLDHFEEADNPYLMPDGQTLYFCGKDAEQSLGGYDLFRTRYDGETGKFLKPENMGLPYNSTDDDLFFIINEQDHLGWFATTRRQKKGNVCVYMFVPDEVRHTLPTDNLTPEALRYAAALGSIAKTWRDNKSRLDAIERRKAIHQQAAKDNEKAAFTLVINNSTTYNKPADCRTAQGRRLMGQWIMLQRQQADAQTELTSLRKQYAQKRSLGPTILKKEEQLEQLTLKIHQTEKDIRKAEFGSQK